MYCEIHHEGIESRAQAQELVELLHIYNMIAPETGVPAKSAIGSVVFERMKPFLMVLEPTENGEYRYLHYGSAIAAVAGFDMTGRCTSDFNNPIGALFRDIYQQAAGLQRPVYTISRAAKASHVHTWERLILPVRQEDGQIGFIVYNRPREFQNDFLRAVLDLVSDGIFALRGIRNEAGVLVDAVIVAANPAAAAMLKYPMEKLLDGHLMDLFPGVVSGGIWDRFVQVIESRQTMIYETQYDADGICGWFRNNVAPLGDGVVVQLTDISDLKNVAATLENRQAELSVELQSRAEEEKMLRKLARTDSLTGVANRRGFFMEARSMIADASHSGAGLAGIVVDLDHFKIINDRYGHAIGDFVLAQVGQTLQEWACESGAIIGRMGGEEFALLMPHHAQAKTEALIEKLRMFICVRPIRTETGPICITSSFGVSVWRPGEAVDTVLERADSALYRAKTAGRNRVEYDLTHPPSRSARSPG